MACRKIRDKKNNVNGTARFNTFSRSTSRFEALPKTSRNLIGRNGGILHLDCRQLFSSVTASEILSGAQGI